MPLDVQDKMLIKSRPFTTYLRGLRGSRHSTHTHACCRQTLGPQIMLTRYSNKLICDHRHVVLGTEICDAGREVGKERMIERKKGLRGEEKQVAD